MAKYNQLVFIKGKEKALDALFVGGSDETSSTPAIFGYLALGYNPNTDANGFEDPDGESENVAENGGFQEIVDAENYERIELKPVSENPVIDAQNGQIIKKYEAELPASNTTNQYINQFAICDTKTISNETIFYSAAAFNTFLKTSDTSITFIVGFKI